MEEVTQDTATSLSLLEKIQGYVLPGRCPARFEHVGVYSDTYRFWRGVYTHVYSHSKCPKSLNTDNFYRQDEIFSLVHENKIIGCILFSYHNAKSESLWDLKYFEDLSPDMIGEIRRSTPNSLMLMESLTVHPEWRRSSSGLPLADILLGVAMKAFQASGCDTLVGTPRVDVKVHRLCERYNGHSLGPIAKSNYQCETFIFRANESHFHPVEETKGQIQQLWDRRIETLKSAVAA
jgi:ribosomal protein S18 acetylase RimI-like enzyme